MTETPLVRAGRLALFSLLLGLSTLASAQQIAQSNQIWSAEVIRGSGQPVIPLFDGWFPNADGSKTICFGYFNMNTDQALDVPAGAANQLSSDYPGLDLERVLLPTHFDPLPPRYRHVFCAFSVRVPADFGEQHRITWQLESNGQMLTVPGKVIAAYVMDEPRSDGRGDVAPLVRVEKDGAAVRGRAGIVAGQTLQAKTREPLTVAAWVEHSDPEVWVGWAQHSGPGTVKFSEKESLAVSGDWTSTEASFSEPGDYVLRMQTIDDIAAFEFYCCHSNAYFHVRVVD